MVGSLQEEVRNSRVGSRHYLEVLLLNRCAVGVRDGDALASFDCQTDSRKHGSHLEIFASSGRLQSEGIKCAKVNLKNDDSKSGGRPYSCACAAVLLSLWRRYTWLSLFRVCRACCTIKYKRPLVECIMVK